MDGHCFGSTSRIHTCSPFVQHFLCRFASLEEASKSLFTWFDNNLVKSNADKCHLLFSSNEKVTIKIGSHDIANTNREKRLGVQLDSGLPFDYHISEICKKASRIACALATVTPSMSLSKSVPL